MEVNRSPSFHTDSPLDKEVKEALIYDTLDLIDLFANDRKRCLEEEKQRARDRLLQKSRAKDSRYCIEKGRRERGREGEIIVHVEEKASG